jgi:hypothetical protein
MGSNLDLDLDHDHDHDPMVEVDQGVMVDPMVDIAMYSK